MIELLTPSKGIPLLSWKGDDREKEDDEWDKGGKDDCMDETATYNVNIFMIKDIIISKLLK
jgi:hypothetical protein